MPVIAGIDARITRAVTRLPFRYGIAEMTEAPHVVIEVRLRDEAGRESRGWASEHLPPKWFTKDPDTAFDDDLVGLVGVVEHAVALAPGLEAPTAFALWRELDARQTAWARAEGIPGLLAGLGTALVERAVIDAACRLAGLPFVEALRSGALGFAPEELHPELAANDGRDLLPAEPAARIALRHTVGLSDALVDEEAEEHPVDALPVSLDGVLRTQGVRFLKVKTAGDAERDRKRLARILELCAAHGVTPQLTIDGNESMRDGEHLDRWARALLGDPAIGETLRASLIAVEQPVHRAVALDASLGPVLRGLAEEGLAVIIDESDDVVDSVRRAMDLGYAGGTYKGCKGVFRGLANAALVAARGRDGARTVLTAEDLSTLPPLTVAQDLVVAAAMGLGHLERNGHHYFGRLAPIDPAVEPKALAAHPDLYRQDADGRVRLRVEQGGFALGSVLAAPFGFAGELDVSGLAPLSLAAARARH